MARSIEVDSKRLSEGLGFGEGSISAKAIRERVEPADLEALEHVISLGDVLVPVSTNKEGVMLDDDGCGDGRPWRKIFTDSGEKFNSLHRPKVFGGGATMAFAGLIGLGKAKQSIADTFDYAVDEMQRHGIDFGAHTDDHAEGPNSGCGAIDKAPTILENIAKYRQEISDTLVALGNDIDEVRDVIAAFGGFRDTVKNEDHNGAQLVRKIQGEGKVVKQLGGSHDEERIIFNFVPGYTIDQERIRKITNNKAQAFVVDIWRLKDIAERAGGSQAKRMLTSMLVYTVGVAATLTAGDHPIDAIIPKPDMVEVAS